MGKNACLLFAMLLVLGVAGWCLKDLRHAGTGKSKAALSAQFLSACDDADVATADHILSGGLDANERDPSGTPLLCYAAISGHTDIVNCLIQHGAKVNDRSAHGYTALMLAAQGNHSQAVETLLFNGADRELKTNVDDCLRHCRCQSSDRLHAPPLAGGSIRNCGEIVTQNYFGNSAVSFRILADFHLELSIAANC